MTVLHDLNTSAPRNEALISIHPTWVYFNKAAAELLRLTAESKVAFRGSDEKNPDGSSRVYVGRRRSSAFKVTRKGSGYRICSTPMSRDLATALQGMGTYRIEDETRETDPYGNTWYNIFYRRYGN